MANLRVSRQHAEVLGDIPNLRVSRQFTEVLGNIPNLRVSRQFTEVLGNIPNLRVSRQHTEVLGNIPNLRISRQFTEVLGNIPNLRVSRQFTEVLGNIPNLRVSRQFAEVLGNIPNLRVSRQFIEILSAISKDVSASSNLSLGQVADSSFIKNMSTSSSLSIGQIADSSLVREVLATSSLSFVQVADYSFVREVLASSTIVFQQLVSLDTVVPETGDINTEIYGTVLEATEYFSQRLHEYTWSKANPSNRFKSLWVATRIIDALNFKGHKHSTYEILQTYPEANAVTVREAEASQFLEFPRDADVEVPQDIRLATYEIASSLLDGKDPELELENLGIISQGYAIVGSSYSRQQVPIEHIINGIPSSQAWRWLRPFLREDDAIVLSRIS